MNNNDEIDIKQIFNLILSKKEIIIKVNFIILFFSITYCIFKTPLYSSYFSVYPINQDSSNIGSKINNLKGLASSVGIDFGGQASTLYYIPDIIESRKLKKNVILNKWSVDNYTEDIDLITYWRINKESILSLSNFVNFILPTKKDNTFSKFIESAIGKFEDRIIIDELDSGLFKVHILMEDPKLAADIANYISNYIENHIIKDINVQSTKYRIFLEDRLKNTQAELNIIEEKLTRFRKANPIALDTPDLQLKRMRLIRDVEINQEVYLTIMTQFELAKMDELKEKPVINILDEAFPAIEKFSPKTLQIIIFSIVFSILLSILMILINNYPYINNQKS